MGVTTELVLVRHGESHCNVIGVAGGERGCTGLTGPGRHQVHQLAGRLAAEHRQRPFQAFYGSPRRRVRETAAIIGEALGVAATTEDGLRHLEHGDADGRPWRDINAEFGGPAQNRPDQPFAPGAESWNQFLRRCTAALRAILCRHTGERILIAAHGETVEAACVLLLRLPATVRPGVGFLTDNAAITRWQRHVDRLARPVWMLSAHNDTRHLE